MVSFTIRVFLTRDARTSVKHDPDADGSELFLVMDRNVPISEPISDTEIRTAH